MRKPLLFVALVLTTTAPIVDAAPVLDVPLPGGYLDVDYFAGAGANTAYFVVDFGGSGGDTHAFGYYFDGDKTAADGLLEIVAAGALDVVTGNFGSESQPNLFINELAYLGESDAPDFSDDGRFWHYWRGTYDAAVVSWTEPDVGISGRDFVTGDVIQLISDGMFVGIYASATSVEPRLPVTVPEPSGFLLAALAILLLSWRARRRIVASVY